MADVNSILYKKGIVDREKSFSLAPQNSRNKEILGSFAINDEAIAAGDKFIIDRMYSGAMIVRVTELVGSTDSGTLLKRDLVTGAESALNIGDVLDADYEILIQCGGAASVVAGGLKVLVESLLIK